MIKIIPSIPSHVRDLAKCLREADAKEITCLGFSPHRILWKSYRLTLTCKTAFVNDEIAAMFGVRGNPTGEIGTPWLLTSPAVEKISSIRFARIYKNEIDKMLKVFPTLTNFVDSSYTKSIRLLEIMGFELEEPQPWGPSNSMFRKFTLGRNHG